LRERPANIRTNVVNRASKAPPLVHGEPGAAAVFHAKVRAIPYEVDEVLRAFTEPLVVVSGHTNERLQTGETANPAILAVGRRHAREGMHHGLSTVTRAG
jgi:hypothetical protein